MARAEYDDSDYTEESDWDYDFPEDAEPEEEDWDDYPDDWDDYPDDWDVYDIDVAISYGDNE